MITIDGSEGEGGRQILLHTTTNAAIINRFLPQHIGMQQETDLVWRIAIS